MRYKKHHFVLINILLFIIITACTSAPSVVVDTLPQYDELFSNEEGWTGADGAYSVALTPNTTAWLFGDTWIGQVKDGRHMNAILVNNSVAIQHDRSPAEAEMDFYFGHAGDGSPAALCDRPMDGGGSGCLTA